MSLERHKRDWEDLAAEDLYWSILSDDDKRFGGWQQDAFLESGRREVDALLERAGALELPRNHARALDFGCGAGRVTRALAAHFDEAVGVDIAAGMVAEAERLNADVASCRFVVNTRPDLALFADSEFDLVYTSIVLQHLPSAAAIRAYLTELVRVLAPGGLLAIQLLSHIPLRHRLQPRRRVYDALRAVGVPRDVLFRRLRLQPIAIRALAVDDVRAVLQRSGAVVVETESRPADGGVLSTTYFATRESSSSAS